MTSKSDKPQNDQVERDKLQTDDIEAASNNKNTTNDFFDPNRRGIWIRGLIMIIFAIFFGIAETLLFFAAVFQFLWMLFSKKPNKAIAKFGISLGKWLERVTLFQAGATEKLPFPWSEWE